MEANIQEIFLVDLIPIEAYLFFPSDNEIRRKSAKNPQRAIFEGNVSYNETEEKGINEFNQEVKKQNIGLPSNWTRSITLRFLQAHAFKISSTITAVQQYVEWAKKKLPMKLTPKIEQYLKKGIMYTFGRDNRFRPIFIINAFMINPKEIEIEALLDMITYFLEYVLEKMLLPGQVETWVVIADLGDQGLTDLPISSIKTVFGYLQNNYRARMHKSYIMNAPFSVKLTWNVIKTFLEETTVEKISMSSKNVNEELFLQVNPQQVEERFGGKAKNLTTFWPPKPCPDVVSVPGEDLSKLIVTQEVYAKYYQEGKLKGHRVNPELLISFNSPESNNGKVVDVSGID